MPRSKRKNKKLPSKGRGRVTRKTSRGPSVTTVPSSQFYSDGERATLKYTDSYMAVQAASGGTLSVLSYKLNSLFQVNQTASSGTPQGISILSGKFKKYIVHGSRIRWRIRFVQPGGNYGSLGVLGVQATHSDLMSGVLYPLPSGAVSPTSIAAASVQKYASKRHDWPRDLPINVGVYEPTQLNPAELWQGTAQMTAAKLDGAPDPLVQEYQAAFGADPSNLAVWLFNFQDVLADATAKGVWFIEVDLLYDVYAFDRVTVGDTLLDPDFPPVVQMPPAGSVSPRLASSLEDKEPASPPETVDRYTLVEVKDLPSERKVVAPPPGSGGLGAGSLPPRVSLMSTSIVPPDRGLLSMVRGR